MKLFKLILIPVLILLYAISIQAEVVDKYVERIDRGAIAIKDTDGYHISWRLLGDEAYNTGFNVYRGTTLLNSEPITDATSYFDNGNSGNENYYVKAVVDGEEIENTKAARVLTDLEGSNAAYFDIPLDQPAKGIHGGVYTPNDASTGDLNGDGEYDIVLMWDPSNSKDNAHSGTTDNVIIDGYTLDGEHLWRIDLGPNIRAGAHYTQFLVYDFDSNGKAEIMCKTAPGTKDASGNYIKKGPAASANHKAEYRNGSGRILAGPEYLTVFDGETGLELATTSYWPLRGASNTWDSGWGDTYGNRMDRFNSTVAYVDGERPSAIFQRGYYGRLTMAAWNWRDGELTRVWTFDSDAGNRSYRGQGNHSIHTFDVDKDGKDEIITGSAVIDNNGTGLHTTGAGHGDACHVSYFIKDVDRPMIFMAHEDSPYGISLRYADTGEVIFRKTGSGDTGRACAGQLDTETPGFNFWGSDTYNLFSDDGSYIGTRPNMGNFMIWWDGDLSREILDGRSNGNLYVDKRSIKYNSSDRLLTTTSCWSNNYTKATPTLSADILGDWREEIVARSSGAKFLRVYTTTIDTDYKLYTLMHDPVYRTAISWQQSSYNQPPHPGFYMASDMDFPVDRPKVKILNGYYRGSGKIFNELMVNDLVYAQDWQIIDSIYNRKSVYNNKAAYAIDLPDSLAGYELLSTSSNSNKYAEREEIATFKAGKDAVIAVFYLSEAETPGWLSSYTKTELSVTVGAATTKPELFTMYQKSVKKGDLVTLGSVGDEETNMYFVIAKPDNLTSTRFAETGVKSFSAYPNPFNSDITIEYNLNSSQTVRLGIYNVSGRLIRTIDAGMKHQGINKTDLNLSNVPEGIYILRMETNSEIIQKKLIKTTK